eukprot:205580-Hanusia_phi.AAC.1
MGSTGRPSAAGIRRIGSRISARPVPGRAAAPPGRVSSVAVPLSRTRECPPRPPGDGDRTTARGGRAAAAGVRPAPPGTV